MHDREGHDFVLLVRPNGEFVPDVSQVADRLPSIDPDKAARTVLQFNRGLIIVGEVVDANFVRELRSFAFVNSHTKANFHVSGTDSEAMI